jgi:hypothetical protein
MVHPLPGASHGGKPKLLAQVRQLLRLSSAPKKLIWPGYAGTFFSTTNAIRAIPPNELESYGNNLAEKLTCTRENI